MRTSPVSMTQLERSGEQPSNHTTKDENRGIAIHATPLPEAGVVFQKAPDGGLTFSFQGHITIDLPPAMAETAGAVINNSADVGYRLIPDGTPPLGEPPAPPEPVQSEEREIITRHITFAQPSESILSASEGQSNGSVPDTTSEPVSSPQSGPDMPSREASGLPQTDSLQIPESKNDIHKFVGNPVRDPYTWTQNSGKRVAAFTLATHPEEGETEFYRIRAYGKWADYAIAHVKKGQKDVQVTAYGPKYRKVTRETTDGQKREDVATAYN
ncbi:MAG: single-stranded DNA-binding protein, partial [Chloroflexota bacterium]|nr:single-stranded DNA-binding protein [Chloroflexota bacterium]